MKKTVKKILVSLALCATAFCFVGGLMPFMNATEASATTAYYTLDGFTIDETAAIRKIEPNGIRFTTELSKETKDAIADLNLKNVTYGTLLLPADLLGAKELTHSTDKVADSVANIWWEEGTKYTTVLAGKSNGDGTFANLSESYYNRPIAARSYVKGTNSDGDTVVYYAKNTAVRSIGYVAVMAQLNPEEAQSDLVDDIASKTNIELVLNPEGQVSAVQNKNDGTGYINNAFQESSNAVAALKIGGVIAPVGTADITYTTENSDVIDINGETITAKKEGSATLTATCTFNGVTYNLEKTIATDAYRAESSYKILITQETENASLISQMSYLPPQGNTAYDTYYRAYEKSAAYKLQSILAEATGHEVPIVVETGNESTADKYISVGETLLAKQSGIAFAADAKDTASKVNKVGETTFILGKTYQGTYYGVQELLGDVAGYEYFMENTYVVDKKVEIVLPETAEYVPDVEWNVSQSYINTAGNMHEHAMQMYTEKIIPLGIEEEKETNGYYYEGIAHNSTKLINDDLEIEVTKNIFGSTTYNDKYDDAPEATRDLYATYKSTAVLTYGQTLYHRMQDHNDLTRWIKSELCYTAHGTGKRATMVSTVADAMYNQMQKYPSLDRIGFSQADHRVWCECSSCTAQGNPTDNLLIFLLDVAAELKTKLTAAGDDRADTFKICTLFYHSTNANPSKTSTYTDKLTGYMKHVEPWFAETGLDHIDPFDNKDGTNNWNETVYGYLQAWATLCNTYGSDMLLWEYYANTSSFFIPYDTVNAIRVNYGIFADLGIDYIFNQMMGSKQTWARLKQYLISELLWNAHPSDGEFDGWISDYFAGSYGPGAEKMKDYYDSMHTWSEQSKVKEAFRADNDWTTEGATNSSLGFDIRSSTYFDADTLTSWINLIDEALDALDVSDPNYETYRKNIMLEKLTPLYLIMWVCDGYEPVMQDAADWLPDPDTNGTFASTTYVNEYGREFLTWVKEWNVVYDGESDHRALKPFLGAIRTVLGIQEGDEDTVKPITYVTETQYVAKSTAATISNAAFVDGGYTVTIDGASVNATAVNGVATFDTTALNSGSIYAMTFVCGDTKVVFMNVAIVTDALSISDTKPVSGGYYAISKNYYVEPGNTQATLVHGIFEKGKTYEVTVDGVASSATSFTAGKLNITLNASVMGESYNVVCVDGDYTYIFTVIAAEHIYTAEELKALGVGGKNEEFTYGEETKTYGNGNSYEEGNNVTGYYVLANDIDCKDVVFAAGYSGGKSFFKATLDGNGYTLSNVTVNEGGIFGGMRDATVKNVRFEDVVYADNLGNYAGNWSNYTALFAHNANGTTFENITIDVKSAITQTEAWVLLEGLFVASTQNNVTYSNITVNAQNLALATALGSNVQEVTYNNVIIRAASYKAIGYTGNEFYQEDTDSDGTKETYQNTDELLTEWPAGVTFQTVTETYSVTTTQTTVGLGTSLTIETDNANLTYTYELASMAIGVTLEGNTVTVGENATVGATFKVIVVGSNGQEEELVFTVTKAEKTFDQIPTIETTVDNNFTLPYSVEGNVQKIMANGYVYYDAAKGIGSIVDRVVTPAAMPVAQEYLGKRIPMTIETETAVYTGAMNVYTMIIDNAAELDSWQEVSAQVAVDQGICLEVQKGYVYSGYFVLGADIEYNKTWKPYKEYGGIWSLYASDAAKAAIFDANGNLIEGAINEDWGAGRAAGFKGVFDGDGHSINGMRTSGKYSAFIVTMAGGTIKDVAFLNAKIGSGASLIAARGAACLENVYVQVTAMESGDTSSSDSITSVLFARGNQNQWVDMNNEIVSKNVIVDISAIDFANLSGVIVSSLVGVHYENLYVIGANESVAESGEVGAANAPCLFVELGGNGLDNKDVVDAFVDYKALLSGTDIATWGGLWKVTAKNEILFGDHMIFDNLTVEDLDDVVTISIKDGTFEAPASIEGEITGVELNGANIFTSADGSVVSFNKEAMPTMAAELGAGKALVIKTTAAVYNLKADVYTDVITTAEELRVIGVGGQNVEFTNNDGTRVYGNGNSGDAGLDNYGYYVLGSDIECAEAAPFAAGNCYQQSWFRGIFDGKGYTIKNITVNEGGIFGGLKAATIQNVNFTGVKYNANLGNYAGNWSNYTALIAHLATDGTKIQGINIQVEEASFRFGVDNMYEGLLYVQGWGGVKVTDVTIDASYLNLENALGRNVNASAVTFDGVVIKAASVAQIAYTDGTGAPSAPVATEWPAGVTFIEVTEGVILGRPTTTTDDVIPTYKEDVTGFGFAADANVFEITSADLWNDRIIFPASTAYDYVEFDVYLTVGVGNLTAWPARDKATQGSMNIYVRSGMYSSNGLVRTVQVFDANGNGFKDSNFVANTLYTVRIGFNDNETVELNQFHFGVNVAQTYYVSAARFGNYSDTEMRIFDASFNVLPYYDGDVTAVGYAAGTKVTAATTTDGWSHRVRVNGDLNFDFVDLQFSVSSEVGATTVWMYGVDGAMLSGSYSVSTSGVTPSADAVIQNKIIQFFDANGCVTSVAKFAANTVYTLRVYLDGATAFDFGMFSVSVTMYFGKISYGNVTDLAETVQIEVEEGSFALPTTIEGTVTSVTLEGKEILSSVEDGKAIINGSAVTAFGQEKTLLIETTEGTYSLYADVATKFITTADELKALGVGGNTNPAEDIYGYYMLANDIAFEHADDYSDLVAAGYPRTGEKSFYGTFDGLGHTLYNMRVADGGIFGIMRGTVKNLNMENVYLIDNPPAGVSNQNGGYISIIAFVAPGGTIENINITMAYSASAWTWKRDGLLVNSGSWGSTTFRNITVDASGLKLKTLLGISHNANNVYENVVITAADYVAIGYTADSYATVDGNGVQNTDALMSEFPAGVTFIRNSKLNVVQTHANATLLVYAGDETALGFAEGTTVYEALQDNRTNMWAAGTNLGLSMEAQRIRITKGLDEDYASIQFSLSREMTGTYAFFAWYMAVPTAGGSRPSTSVYFNKDGSSGNNNGFSAIAFDMNGKQATSFVPGQAYELRWYDANHIAYGFEFGCCEQNGEAITVYFANPSSGYTNPVTVGNSSTSQLYTYMGDETAVGFAEGTDVYYEVQDNRTAAWGAGDNGLTFEQQTVVITKEADEDYASIQFSLSRELTATGSIFTAWWYDEAAVNKGLCGYLKADGSSTISDTTLTDFKVEVYDMDGNKVTKLEANTAYEMRWYGTGITQFKIGCMEANGEAFTIYWANPSSSNNA